MNTKLIQRYIVECAEPENAEKGQIVFPNNDSDEASGFVYMIHRDTNQIEIVFFEEREMPIDNIIPLSMEGKDWTAMLDHTSLRNADPSIQEYWRELLKNS